MIIQTMLRRISYRNQKFHKSLMKIMVRTRTHVIKLFPIVSSQLIYLVSYFSFHRRWGCNTAPFIGGIRTFCTPRSLKNLEYLLNFYFFLNSRYHEKIKSSCIRKFVISRISIAVFEIFFPTWNPAKNAIFLSSNIENNYI